MATKTIAAYNSPAEKKAIADYVCDGSADQEQINAAINSGAYDIMLFEGTYNITGSIHVRGGTVKPIVAEVSVFRRAETYQVVATVQKIVATAYSDIYGVTGAISHVGPISAFTEVITYSNRYK